MYLEHASYACVTCGAQAMRTADDITIRLLDFRLEVSELGDVLQSWLGMSGLRPTARRNCVSKEIAVAWFAFPKSSLLRTLQLRLLHSISIHFKIQDSPLLPYALLSSYSIFKGQTTNLQQWIISTFLRKIDPLSSDRLLAVCDLLSPFTSI